MKMIILKTYFGFSSILAPEKTGKKSFELFQQVRKKSIRDREKEFYNDARTFKVHRDKEPIDCFELGNPNGSLVFLVHGWDSNAGSMSKLAYKFVKEGYRVITFNLPGHAFYKSSSTNLLECKKAFEAVVEFINPTEAFSIVSHSFGSAVVANAMANKSYNINSLVFLTNPNKVEDIFVEFKEVIGLRKKAYKALIKHTTRILGAPIETLDVSTNMSKISYDRFLMIHDKYDTVLPYKNSVEINSEVEKSQLIGFEKIGHYKMLWNEEVIGRTFAFVDGQVVA